MPRCKLWQFTLKKVLLLTEHFEPLIVLLRTDLFLTLQNVIRSHSSAVPRRRSRWNVYKKWKLVFGKSGTSLATPLRVRRLYICNVATVSPLAPDSFQHCRLVFGILKKWYRCWNASSFRNVVQATLIVTYVPPNYSPARTKMCASR